jgi:hypothetical protein
MTNRIAPSAAMNRKAARKPNRTSSRLPTIGPATGPIESSVEASASARAPAAGSNVSRMIARDTTTTVQHPIAWTKRATISTPMPGLAAHARLATT